MTVVFFHVYNNVSATTIENTSHQSMCSFSAGNPCTTGANPCMNGGICSTPSDFGSFNCDCSQTVWSGSTCNGRCVVCGVV